MTDEDLSSWVSWHLFYQGSRDRLLLDLVRPLVCELWQEGSIDNFFFIRYALGGPHVRLRLHCLSGRREAAGDRVESAAADFFRRWPSEVTLTEEEIRRTNRNLLANDSQGEDVVLPSPSALELPFCFESERYGGQEFAGHSLDLFALSSAHVLSRLAIHAGVPRGRWLPAALRTLAQLSPALAWSGESFLDLIQYAAVWSKGDGVLFVQRGDEAFDRNPVEVCRMLRQEIEAFLGTGPRSLLSQGARRLARLTVEAGPAARREIAVGQIHMTCNRLGLSNAEEIYLGRLLWRAAEQIRQEEPGLWSLLESSLEPTGTEDGTSLRSLVPKAFVEHGDLPAGQDDSCKDFQGG